MKTRAYVISRVTGIPAGVPERMYWPAEKYDRGCLTPELDKARLFDEAGEAYLFLAQKSSRTLSSLFKYQTVRSVVIEPRIVLTEEER